MRTNLLKAKLKECNVRQADVADNLGISVSCCNSKINGRTDFTLQEIRKLKSYFNLTSAEIDSIFFAE